MKRIRFSAQFLTPCLLLVVAGSAAAQARTIAPGMTRAQVEERLGPPLTARTTGQSTFLFYHNGCERKCGMHDIVVLDSDRVTDAVFRSSDRHYTGASSSPEAIPPEVARGGGSTKPLQVPPKPALAGKPRPPQPASATVPARSEIRIPIDAKNKQIGKDSGASRDRSKSEVKKKP